MRRPRSPPVGTAAPSRKAELSLPGTGVATTCAPGARTAAQVRAMSATDISSGPPNSTTSLLAGRSQTAATAAAPPPPPPGGAPQPPGTGTPGPAHAPPPAAPAPGPAAAGFADPQLASGSRVLAWNDPQAERGARGRTLDRNVELVLRDPRLR